VQGSGAGIGGRADAFRYVYKRFSGNGEIVARVASVQNTDRWAMAGVMIRETLSADSRQALMAVTPGRGAVFQARVTSGAASLHTTGPAKGRHHWVKLVRRGNQFRGYVSEDAKSWVLVDSSTINMKGSVYIGLAVTSHDDSALCTTTFDKVQ
jgi:regulation of enolase protein 1 (concanavalin A-like superfamily)